MLQFLGTLQGKVIPPMALKALMSGDETVETALELSVRALRWWNQYIVPLAAKRVEEGAQYISDILVTSHGGTISQLFNAAQTEGMFETAPGVRYMRCWNTSVSIVEVDEELKGLVTMYADVSHLLKKKVVGANADEIEGDR